MGCRSVEVSHHSCCGEGHRGPERLRDLPTVTSWVVVQQALKPMQSDSRALATI